MKSSIKNLFVCIVFLFPAGLCAQYGDQISGNDFLRTVKVNRWVSPVVGDFVTIPESHATDAQMASWGYKSKIFQYEAWLDNPGDEGTVAVYRWTMPNCNDFIILAEHEHTDTQLESWGYRDKKFLFYAFKTPPNSSYVAVNRWISALPQGNSCRDYTLSVLATEFTDEQLTSWGYGIREKKYSFMS